MKSRARVCKPQSRTGGRVLLLLLALLLLLPPTFVAVLIYVVLFLRSFDAFPPLSCACLLWGMVRGALEEEPTAINTTNTAAAVCVGSVLGGGAVLLPRPDACCDRRSMIALFG